MKLSSKILILIIFLSSNIGYMKSQGLVTTDLENRGLKGKVKFIKEFEGTKNTLVEHITYNEKGNITTLFTNSFNDNKVYHYNNEGRLYGIYYNDIKEIYSYIENKIIITTYLKESVIKIITKVVDENNKLSKTLTKFVNSKQTRKEWSNTYIYFYENDILTSISNYDNNEKLKEKIIIKYENNRMIKKTIKTIDEHIEIKSFSYKNSLLIEEDSFFDNLNGFQKKTKKTYTYNKSNNLVVETFYDKGGITEKTIKYKYDMFKNVVQKTIKTLLLNEEIYSYEIEYYN